ncbi:MAG: hypothetical protein H6733_09800 [Alphaproteobacteria bacterium]|nr:hypothetical protein [Alphaproteobacteria bacterium]
MTDDAEDLDAERTRPWPARRGLPWDFVEGSCHVALVDTPVQAVAEALAALSDVWEPAAIGRVVVLPHELAWVVSVRGQRWTAVVPSTLSRSDLAPMLARRLDAHVLHLVASDSLGSCELTEYGPGASPDYAPGSDDDDDDDDLDAFLAASLEAMEALEEDPGHDRIDARLRALDAFAPPLHPHAFLPPRARRGRPVLVIPHGIEVQGRVHVPAIDRVDLIGWHETVG